jgi:AAA domain/Bifunctional DNA primase/polymerase, N-terminal
MLHNFDEEFASPADYARLYRSIGLQVVPSMLESEKKAPSDTIKRPIINWRQFTQELISDEQFDEWYGRAGIYSKRGNLGILTGVCSGRVFVLDLDTHKNPVAQLWWDNVQQTYGGAVSETPTQRTGGGGLQLLFRYPESWVPPTIRTQIGVDIRGVGGFAVIAPSKHESGKYYEWLEGLAPHEVEIAMAPDGFLAELDDLAAQNGHVKTQNLTETVDPQTGEITYTVKTPTPQYAETAWGEAADGREDKMTRMVWGRILDMYRDCPIAPTQQEQLEIRRELFDIYVSKVVTRINDPGQPKHLLLEREGRGISLFNHKWSAAMRLWDTKVAEQAQVIREKVSESPKRDSFSFGADPEAPIKIETPQTPDNIFTLLRAGAIMAMPDPEYLVEDVIPAESFGFIVGVPGCLKTFIAMGLGLAAAAGLDEWLGYKVKKHGPVVYVTSEGFADIKNRLYAWKKMTGIDPNTIPFYAVPDSMNFMQKPDVYKIVKTIQHAQEMEGKPVVAVFIDTMSRVLPGADENLQKDMTQAVAACDYIKTSFKCAVVGVHHMSRNGNGTMRGSTVFDGAADFILWVQREPGQMFGTITAQKIKTAPDGWEIDFTVIQVAFVTGFGRERSSLYIERTVHTGNVINVDFGGKQETGSAIVSGIRLPNEVWNAFFEDLDAAVVAKKPWTDAANATARYAANKMQLIIGERFKNVKLTESDAKKLVKYFTVSEIWVEYDYQDNRTTKKGLRVDVWPSYTKRGGWNPPIGVGSNASVDNDAND